MDAKTFRKLGYLQELNRNFLHPLGLALEIVINSETGEESFDKIWDYRDDPEGLMFGEDMIDSEKAARIKVEFHLKAIKRIEALGWVIQPILKSGAGQYRNINMLNLQDEIN